MEAEPTAQAIKVFYSYAHEDEDLRKELQGHLKILEHSKQIANWDDRMILPGEAWDGSIRGNIRDADLVLFLISVHFINSTYIMSTEVKLAMERHEKNAARVIPIMLRPVDITADDVDVLPFMKNQGLPTNLRPVVSWRIRDQAWTDVAKGIRARVKELRALKPKTAVPTPPTPQVAGPDPVLETVIDGFGAEIQEASRERGAAPPSTSGLAEKALALIDTPEHRRILWVDDNPDNNIREIAALSKLQVEVHTVRSTDEALACLRTDSEGFDLVLSDWSRNGEAPLAGLRLLNALREARLNAPVVYYHGEYEPTRRSSRTEAARSAGAFGEAVYPEELMELVTRALARQNGASRPSDARFRSE